MPTQSEIARDWGVDPAYISRLVRKGLPLDSFEHARLWRKSHANRRDPTGFKAAEVMDEDSPESRERRRKEWLDRPEGWKPTNGSLDEALEASIQSCNEAWRILQEAFIEGTASKISVWLSLHNRAVEARVKVERLIREEQERQKILIPMSEAQTTTRRVVEIVVSRLASLPQNLAHACNPSSPDHAFEILQRECASIMTDAQKAIA
jgi:hypothetical protein